MASSKKLTLSQWPELIMKHPEHIPVLLNEVLHFLSPKPNENFIDATFGMGGHTTAILESNGPGGRVLGIELDVSVYEKSSAAEWKKRLILRNDSYTNIEAVASEEHIKPISGILFDLGFSSWHIEGSGRGFTFQKNEPLDMRYQTSSNSITAEDVVNELPERELGNIFLKYGQERFAFRISKAIMEARKKSRIKTTYELAELIDNVYPARFSSRLHPATKTFQALRIYVNQELEAIEKTLPTAFSLLSSGGRLVVISFHSLEDRIVKNYFRSLAQKKRVTLLTKKPVVASGEELVKNPRARSAKLRALIKI